MKGKEWWSLLRSPACSSLVPHEDNATVTPTGTGFESELRERMENVTRRAVSEEFPAAPWKKKGQRWLKIKESPNPTSHPVPNGSHEASGWRTSEHPEKTGPVTRNPLISQIPAWRLREFPSSRSGSSHGNFPLKIIRQIIPGGAEAERGPGELREHPGIAAGTSRDNAAASALLIPTQVSLLRSCFLG